MQAGKDDPAVEWLAPNFGLGWQALGGGNGQSSHNSPLGFAYFHWLSIASPWDRRGHSIVFIHEEGVSAIHYSEERPPEPKVSLGSGTSEEQG